MRENPLGNDEKVLISFPAASCLLKFLIKFHFCLISIVEIVKSMARMDNRYSGEIEKNFFNVSLSQIPSTQISNYRVSLSFFSIAFTKWRNFHWKIFIYKREIKFRINNCQLKNLCDFSNSKIDFCTISLSLNFVNCSVHRIMMTFYK